MTEFNPFESPADTSEARASTREHIVLFLIVSAFELFIVALIAPGDGGMWRARVAGFVVSLNICIVVSAMLRRSYAFLSLSIFVIVIAYNILFVTGMR